MAVGKAALRLVCLLALGVVGVQGGIYPDGHFEISTKLTKENYRDVIRDTVDAGKTLFAPGWNAAVQAFGGNSDVAFGDVNLSEEQIRKAEDGTPFNPGAGGWPTMRYFNKETGYAGAPYEKKTSKAMCDELKDEEYMFNFIQEAGSTSLCSLETGQGCSEKEIDYASKWKLKTIDEITNQKTRLHGMLNAKLKPDTTKWIKQRLALLEQLEATAQPTEL